MSPRIIPRAEWGARPARSRIPMRTPTPELWLHHTAAEQHGDNGVRQTQAFHMDSRNYQDIAYSFLVDVDGTIYEGRGAGVIGSHTAGHNSKSHAICLMGNYENRPVPPEAATAVRWLRDYGAHQGWWPDTFTGGHRQASGASTACPGRFGMELLQRLARPANPTPEPEDDMTDEQARQLSDIRDWMASVNHQIPGGPDHGLLGLEAKVDRLTVLVAALTVELRGP